MPKVTKIQPVTPKKRGRPKKSEKQVMYLFRCEDGCEAQFMSRNASESCGLHRKEMECVN